MVIKEKEKYITLSNGIRKELRESKALTNSTISAEEFALVIKEKEKYITLSNGIRKELRETESTADVEALKKTFLEEGKKQANTEMMENLKKQS